MLVFKQGNEDWLATLRSRLLVSFLLSGQKNDVQIFVHGLKYRGT